MSVPFQSWLDVQCKLVPGITRAVILSGKADAEQLEPSAVWPSESEDIPAELYSAAEQVAKRGTAVVHTLGKPEEGEPLASIVASPLPLDNGEVGVAAVEVIGQATSKTQIVLQLMQWGTAWFSLLSHHEGQDDVQSSRLKTVAEVLITALEHGKFQAAATTVVTELATRMDCERVSLGLLKKRKIEIIAVSHNAQIDKRSAIMRDVATAMEEAIDQDSTVSYPALEDEAPQVSFAQEVLVERNNGNAVCSTPLYNNGKPIGAFTFEARSTNGFDRSTMELCESLGALLGPILELKFHHDRPFFMRIWDGLWNSLVSLLGPKQFMLKLLTLSLVIFFGYISSVDGDYRVRAPATLEPAIKQYITSPQTGFIAKSRIRAGDRVKKGQVLATLDTREIELERVKLQSEYEQLLMEKRAGLLSREDRSKVAIAAAQIKQNEARLKLLEEQMGRAKIVAPYDGIIVSGDLTQSLGTPIEAGETLFEIAPVDTYRIRLDIDERDIGEVELGDKGKLALTSLPNQPIAFTVQRLLPVSESRDGKNYFQVEASIKDTSELLRPGMKGIAKVDIEQRKLIWIWFHRLINWAQLQLWTWVG